MSTIPVRETKIHLSRLIERVEAGEAVAITRAGRPVAKLVPIDAPQSRKKRRLGFMAGQFTVPDDFDRMGAKEIEDLFGAP